MRLAAGAYVCVEISDNGCGIEPEVLPRVFEPFFTTKRGASHRGLGLAWVYGIVTNHGGGVAVSSQPGTGTSVRVYLPAEKRIVRDDGVTSGDLSGSQTILMVDDEDLLLTMGKTILSAYGYRVLTANGGQKALEILSQKDTSVDLVITDLVMPAMSGRELVEHIRKLSPADAHHLHQRLRVAGGPGERRRLPAKAVHQPGTAAQSQAGPPGTASRRRRLKQQLTAFVKCCIQCSYANRESEGVL